MMLLSQVWNFDLDEMIQKDVSVVFRLVILCDFQPVCINHESYSDSNILMY